MKDDTMDLISSEGLAWAQKKCKVWLDSKTDILVVQERYVGLCSWPNDDKSKLRTLANDPSSSLPETDWVADTLL